MSIEAIITIVGIYLIGMATGFYIGKRSND